MNFLTEQCSKEATMNRGRKTAKTIMLLIGVGFALSACADAGTAGYAYGPGYVYEEPDYGWLGFSDGGIRDHGFRHGRDRGFDDHHAGRGGGRGGGGGSEGHGGGGHGGGGHGR
jgi:hypothetical protein